MYDVVIKIPKAVYSSLDNKYIVTIKLTCSRCYRVTETKKVMPNIYCEVKIGCRNCKSYINHWISPAVVEYK